MAKAIEVVEFQLWRGYCGGCGSQVAAPLPEDVVAGEDLGVSLQAMLVWLSHYGHLSYGKQQEWLKELGDVEVGVGTLVATMRRARKRIDSTFRSTFDPNSIQNGQKWSNRIYKLRSKLV
ncbi:MAG: hypothetical protein ACFB5Z_17355 [Elainellaceae cyanobacterium]